MPDQTNAAIISIETTNHLSSFAFENTHRFVLVISSILQIFKVLFLPYSFISPHTNYPLPNSVQSSLTFTYQRHS